MDTKTVYHINKVTGNNATFELSDDIEYNFGEMEIKLNGEPLCDGAVSITLSDGVLNIEAKDRS